MEAAPIGEFVGRYSFGCREALNEVLDPLDIVRFDDCGHIGVRMVVGINDTEYS